MKLTLQIQLFPDKEQARQLQSTIERFNHACSWLAEQAFELGTANKIKLQRLFYYELRERFGLSAQMAAICIRHVGGIYSPDKSIKPVFRKDAAMPYDSRVMSFKGIDRVSLLTLEGRVIVPFIMGKYQAQRFSLAKGQCDLVRRRDGKWFLLVTADVPDKTPVPANEFIGVDFGVVNIATDSEGEIHTNDEMSKWSFGELRAFIEYKGKLAGVPVIPVDPRNTSRTCPECGHIDKGNRLVRGIFLCRESGHFDHADVVGAKNIATAAKVAWREVAAKTISFETAGCASTATSCIYSA
jgi:predicted transposase